MALFFTCNEDHEIVLHIRFFFVGILVSPMHSSVQLKYLVRVPISDALQTYRGFFL